MAPVRRCENPTQCHGSAERCSWAGHGYITSGFLGNVRVGHKGTKDHKKLSIYGTVQYSTSKSDTPDPDCKLLPTSQYSSPLFPIANTNVPYRLCRFVWNGPVATNCQSQFGRENKKFIIFVDLTGSLIHSRPHAVTLSTSQPRPPVSSGLSTTDGRH